MSSLRSRKPKSVDNPTTDPVTSPPHQSSSPKRFYIFLIVVLVVVLWLLYEWLLGSWYIPGTVREGSVLSAPLDPPTQQHFVIGSTVRGGVQWKLNVTPEISIFAWSSEILDVNKENLHVALVVHGGPAIPPKEEWTALKMLEANYKGKYLFIYYHQRGCGNSTRPFTNFIPGSNYFENSKLLVNKLGLQEHIADIERIRRILIKEGIVQATNKFILIGHSFGGLIAALYAAEFPENVNGLVLLSPANLIVSPLLPEADVFSIIRSHLVNLEGNEATVSAFDSWKNDYLNFGQLFERNEQVLAQLHSQFIYFWARAAAKTPANSNVEEIGGWSTMAIYLSMGLKHDYSEILKQTRAPVLVVHGSMDLQPISTSKNFADFYKNSQFLLIPEASHFAFDETPFQFSQILHQFFQSIS